MLYAIEAIGLDRVKIGFTSTNAGLARRFESFQVGSPVELAIIGVRPDSGEADEQRIHRHLSGGCVRGEWFVKSYAWPLVGSMFSELQLGRCERCGGELPLSAFDRVRRGRSSMVCSVCHVAERKLHSCLRCGKAISSKSAQGQRARLRNGEAPGCRSCRSLNSYQAWWRAGLEARGITAPLNSIEGLQAGQCELTISRTIGNRDEDRTRTRTEAP